MKKVELLLHPPDVDVVKDRLRAIGVHAMLVSEVKAVGPRARTEVYRGSVSTAGYTEETRLQIYATDDDARRVVDAVQIVAAAGRIGDGAIVVAPVEEALGIESGERGDDAL